MKLISTCLILAFVAVFSPNYAQVYTPFHLNNSQWIVSTIYPNMGPGDGGKVWKYRTGSDTIINGNSYTSLYLKDLCEYWPDSQTGARQYVLDLDTASYLIGGIRENDRRIYFFDYKTQEEILLYDFIAGVGDTVIYDQNNYTIILDEEVSPSGIRILKAKNKNAFNFPDEECTITEGMGSSYGLFGSYQGGLNSLNCFTVNDTILYGPCAYCQGIPTAIVDKIPQSRITLSPNPADKNITIENIPNAFWFGTIIAKPVDSAARRKT